MNKQIEELALRVAKEMPNGFLWSEGCDHESGIVEQEILEFSKAFLAELAKQSEPAHWRAVLQNQQGEITATPKIAGFQDLKAAEQFCAEKKDFQGWNYAIEPLYLHTAQADLAAEIERVKLEADWEVQDLRQRLAAAQADNDELVKVLEELSCLGNGNSYGNSHGNVIAQKAIAAHKARQAKCDPTLTQCPRCNNDISKCDGAFKARQGKEES